MYVCMYVCMYVYRLFLTMDPAHGEISRPMRNRGIEIFLLPEVRVTISAGSSPNVYLLCTYVERAWEWSVSTRQPFSAELWRIGPLPLLPSLGTLHKYVCMYGINSYVRT